VQSTHPSPDAVPAAEQETEVESAAPAEDAGIERLLEHVPEGAPITEARPAPLAPGLRSARVTGLRGRTVDVVWRGQREATPATLDEGVDREVVEQAMENGDLVLVEVDPAGQPFVIGVIQRKVPEALTIKAQKLTLEADQEVTLRAGRAALRLREDGDVELVGSRISTMSRGLFRIVGRVLRLN
jgi:hypothetical protein